MDHPSDSIKATFLLSCSAEEASDRARFIALEQTVEIPEGCFSEAIEERIVGQIQELAPEADGRFRVVISYHPRVVGREFGQLLNLLFGNISLSRGILLVDIEWPREVLDCFAGPALGIPGLRTLCNVPGRPLVCAAAKPLGLTVHELARDCHEFALGGADIIKDDHSLADQEMAPFRERVARCRDAVHQANALTGGNTLYFPNLFGTPPLLSERLAYLHSLSFRGAMISPMILGLEAVRWLAGSGLALLGHPTFSGTFFGPTHGMPPQLLLGDLFRVAGCDGVIFVNAGGRFSWSEDTCQEISRRLRRPLGPIRPAFPVPAGGVDVDRVPYWLDRYGPDTMVLIGGSLYQRRDLRRATSRLVGVAEQFAP